MGRNSITRLGARNSVQSGRTFLGGVADETRPGPAQRQRGGRHVRPDRSGGLVRSNMAARENGSGVAIVAGCFLVLFQGGLGGGALRGFSGCPGLSNGLRVCGLAVR